MSYPAKLPECLNMKSMFARNFPNRFLLKRLSKSVANYSRTFYKTLRNHYSTEYEVQIRAGQLTEQSSLILNSLQQDSYNLDYKENLKTLILRSQTARKTHKMLTFELLCVVEDAVTEWFEKEIVAVQKKTLKEQRKKNFLHISAKCSSGPQIYNFTNEEINHNLALLLKSGLNNVPYLEVPSKDVKIDIVFLTHSVSLWA